ncbi:mucin-19 [Denticeps clupeoides]|uniref:BTB/POZ domain-containing protein n=1 Tax=Denticeps clupeoides TaxID=299321 RepID=A0AAY4A0W0_9TELE|nr:mucin-19-like [Denticeps clupeoides]XP_028827848.1 mucin-19-like [Denticeps clupeoides]XP_028827849.1 mucin-19-like [Denticeps clupeoides]
MQPDGVDMATEDMTEGPGAEGVAMAEEPKTKPGAPAAKGTASKFPEPKSKAKGPPKGRPGTAVAGGAGSRPPAAPSWLANGVQRAGPSEMARKTSTTAIEKKTRPASAAGTSTGPVKRPAAPVTTTAPGIRRPPTAAPEKKTVSIASRTSATDGKKTAVASKRPAVGVGPSAAARAKPATAAPAARASSAVAATKPPASRTSRPPGGVTSRPVSTATVKSAAMATRPSSAPPGGKQNPSGKRSTLPASVQKDASKAKTAVPGKPSAAATRALTTRPSRPDQTKAGVQSQYHQPVRASRKADAKPAAPPRRPAPNAPDGKAAQPKRLETTKPPPPQEKVQVSPRVNLPRMPSVSQRPVGSSTPIAVKKIPKPTQSVYPLAVNGRPASWAESVDPVAVATVAAHVHPVSEARPEPDGAGSVVSTEIQPAAGSVEETVEVPVVEVPLVLSTADGASRGGHELAESTSEPLSTAMSSEDPGAPVQPEAAERTRLDEEEERDEGSQQVSMSEMSGTQPTEESRPGSAGLAGSIWRAGAMFSEMDSEEVSCSQQGASELSAPGVLEGTESMDDLGEASLKGPDEGASAGSPDFEKVPDIPANDDDEDEGDDEDYVCDMEVCSEQAEDSRPLQQDGDEDEDVEMASEAVTESGLESYGNADDDDDYFPDDYRIDNLNRTVPPPLPCPHPASAALLPHHTSEARPEDSDTPIQLPSPSWLGMGTEYGTTKSSPHSLSLQPGQGPSASTGVPSGSRGLQPTARGMSQSSTLSGTELAAHSSSDTSTPEELCDHHEPSSAVLPEPAVKDEVVRAAEAVGSPPSSATEDEASDTEGEMQLDEAEPRTVANGDSLGRASTTPPARGLSALAEHEEDEVLVGGDTPQSAGSYGSNVASTAENSSKSPGIFSLENEEQLPEEAKDQSLIQELKLIPALVVEVDLVPLGRVLQKEGGVGEPSLEAPEPGLAYSPSDRGEEVEERRPLFSPAEETEDSPAGSSSLDQDWSPHQRCPWPVQAGRVTLSLAPRLPVGDLPPRMQSFKPPVQLRRLEEHQRHVQEIERRHEGPSRADVGADEPEAVDRKCEDPAAALEMQQRDLLQLQLQQHQQDLQQRQQDLDQQRKQRQKAPPAVLLSPSSGLCTIYEVLESEEDEEMDRLVHEPPTDVDGVADTEEDGSSVTGSSSTSPEQDVVSQAQQIGGVELDWGAKVDIVQQLINQTLLLASEGCSPLLLLPGGAGGTLSPLESSLWPSLLPPLTPPSATVTSVSSFSPEAAGTAQQGDWTVVELETHH